LRQRERAENFPVALRVLPRDLRRDLRAVYGVARVLDDLGDAAPGDRAALLTAFRADLRTIWGTGSPRHPVLRRLAPTVAARRLPREPFERLVLANLQDQRVFRYRTFADLRGYCALSAEPVGRIVLGVFGVRDPAAALLSDRICTALQLVEHWQDVTEDRRAGRIYLPLADMAAFEVAETDLDRTVTPPALRRLLLFETDRAAELLDTGSALVGRLHGWARIAVTGFLAGGYATVDALRRADGEVLRASPRPRRRDVLRHAVALLVRALVGGAR
jgi:squalene synthase HpnC